MTTAIARPRCDPDEYAVAMKNISKARPRVNVDAWTEYDAAKWWYNDYDPDKPNALSPQLITGIVARLFVKHYHRVPPIGNFLVALRSNTAAYDGCFGQSNRPGPVAMRLNSLCSHVQTAYHPARPDWDGTNDRQTCVSELENPEGYCHRKSCKEQHSFLQGCMRESAFERMLASGYLVPWHSVNWGGLGLLMTPVRHATDTPYIYIRRDRSHIKKNFVPYYVADAVGNLHRIVPSLMRGANDSFVNFAWSQIHAHVAALETERLRFHGVVAMHPDCEAIMQRWDYSFIQSCWMFGTRSKVYNTFAPSWWEVDHQTWNKLDDSEPDDLFPEIPELQYEFDRP